MLFRSKMIKRNIYYIGHNVGSLRNELNDDLLMDGEYSHQALIRVFKKYGKDTDKLMHQRYKQYLENVEQKILKQKQREEEYDNKMNTDAEFRKRQLDFKKWQHKNSEILEI